MTIVASDGGTGITRIAISSPDYPAWNQVYDNDDNWYDCTILYAPGWGCPRYVPRSVPVGNLPDGPHTIRVQTWDANGNSVTNTYTAQVILHPTSWAYGGADHSINTTPEIEATAAALFSVDDDQFQTLFEGLSVADYNTLIAWRGTDADWYVDADNSLDDSDIPEVPGESGHTTSIRAHWGHWHIHRRWSDTRAKEKARFFRDSAQSMAAVGIGFGLTADVPGAIVSAVFVLGFGSVSNRVYDAREDANGRGITVDLGFRCAHVPAFPDPCLPALWIKPILAP